ncbi:MAG: ABC transporter permease [Planctomycetota bacterium]|jgi:Cu-processing system permease protein|nr:MAG: ABC transporter permease [Planctomycetota bacterium]
MLACTPAPESALANIWAIARRELRDALRSRWFALNTAAFVLLGVAVSFLSASAGGGEGLSGFGRTTAGLVNLVTLVVPLMALTAGAASVAGERERGMLAFLLSQPVTRFEVIAGKWLGLALALTASIFLGFGLCAAIVATRADADGASALVVLALLTQFLALGMLGVGLLISVLSRRTSMATGLAVFIWLLLAFATDLGLMAGTLTWKLSIQSILAACIVNPLQIFKIWSLDASGIPLDVLGPVGQYVMDKLPTALPWIAAGSLTLWAVVPVLVAAFLFARKPAA